MLSDAELNALKADDKKLIAELESAGVRVKGRAFKCPFHDDHTASAGIFLHDGHWLVKCHGCGFSGSIIDVTAKLSKITPEEVLSKLGKANEWPRPSIPSPRTYSTVAAIKAMLCGEAAYEYCHPDSGAPEMVVVRYIGDGGKKKFVQASPSPGGFVLKSPPHPWPIYNRRRVREAPAVVVVEGEKCVHALQNIGIVATTSPGGALKASYADWTPLAGKTVFLWPDNDAPEEQHPEGKGVAHMREVAKILLAMEPATTVFWIDVSKLELPVKGDAADFVERYKDWTREEIKATVEAAVLADAEQLSAVDGYAKYVQDAIDGKRRPLPFPWRCLTKATRALLPGKITCIIGDPGSGKSLWVMEMIVAWNQLGIKACVYELEDSREDHLARAHAQIDGNAGMTDAEWIEQNPETAKESLRRHRKMLDELAKCIYEAPEDQATLKDLVDWVEARAREGYQIIVIDPITAAKPEVKPWIADCEFIVKIKTIARRYGSRVIVVVHFKKGHKGNGGGLDDIAGGAAWGRLSHTAIWLEVYDKDDEVSVRMRDTAPPEMVLPNRIARVLKARNGPGRGKRIAFDFKPGSLRYEELGLMESTS